MNNDFIQNAVNNLYQANELMALKAENARLLSELANLKAKADQFESENLLVREEADRYCRLWQKAQVEVESLMTSPTSRLLRAEREKNARLKADLAKSEEHNDALCERMSDLNSELFAASNINGKLHMERVRDLNQMGGQCEEIARLKGEVERLTIQRAKLIESAEKLFRFVGQELYGPIDHFEAAWEAAKEGKQS
jgi:chromosome segregation ATPase